MRKRKISALTIPTGHIALSVHADKNEVTLYGMVHDKNTQEITLIKPRALIYPSEQQKENPDKKAFFLHRFPSTYDYSDSMYTEHDSHKVTEFEQMRAARSVLRHLRRDSAKHDPFKNDAANANLSILIEAAIDSDKAHTMPPALFEIPAFRDLVIVDAQLITPAETPLPASN